MEQYHVAKCIRENCNGCWFLEINNRLAKNRKERVDRLDKSTSSSANSRKDNQHNSDEEAIVEIPIFVNVKNDTEQGSVDKMQANNGKKQKVKKIVCN